MKYRLSYSKENNLIDITIIVVLSNAEEPSIVGINLSYVTYLKCKKKKISIKYSNWNVLNLKQNSDIKRQKTIFFPEEKENVAAIKAFKTRHFSLKRLRFEQQI